MARQEGKAALGSFVSSLPTKVIFGFDKIDSVGEEVKGLGSHALVVAAAKSMEKIGALGRVTKALESSGVAITIFQDVQPNPAVPEIDRVGTLCRKSRCDVVVGLGGGSALDFAKGVAVCATHEGSVWDYIGRPGYLPKTVTNKTLPVVAIPTTSGTGSEVTSVAVISNPSTHEKPGIVSSHIVPASAIVDPGLTVQLPPRLTASTGFDALAHALETFLSKSTSPFSDMVSLAALELIGASLHSAVETPDNLSARERMAWGATLAGIALNHAGMTVNHGISQALGGRFDIAHGDAVALYLPEVVERAVGAVGPERAARAADALGVSRQGMTLKKKAEACIQELKDLRRLISQDLTLSQFGVTESDVEAVVADVFGYLSWSVASNPWAATPEDVRDILCTCM